MRIIQIVPTIGPGGAEAFTVDLAVAFRELGFLSCVYVICDIRGSRGRLLAARLRDSGVDLHVGGISSPRRIQSLRNVLRMLKDRDWDVILAHLASTEVIVGLSKLLLGSKNPVVLRTVHSSRKRAGLARLLEPLLSLVFSKTIACSKEVLDSLGGPSARREFVDNGIDVLNLGQPLFTAFADSTRIVDKYRLAMVGSARSGLIGGPKGIDTAIEAICHLGDGIDVELHVLGCPDSDRAMICRYASCLGVADRVVVNGPFESIREELSKIAPIACLLPSRYEGLPLSLMEFSCLGIPVVASNIPQVLRLDSTDMLWTTFDSGSSADLASAIESSLLADAHSIDKLAAYADAAREKFRFDRCRDGYLAVIRSCGR